MAQVKITKTEIGKLLGKPLVSTVGKDGRTRLQGETIWDTEIPGFGAKLQPGGRVSYFMLRRIAGRRVYIRIGWHSEFNHPDDARAIARQHATTIAAGLNPIAERRKQARIPTVQELAEAYLAGVRERRKAGTAKQYDSILRTHILPRFGKMKATELSALDVAALFKKISHGGALYQANRALAVISAMYRWACRPSVLLLPAGSENPALGIERNPEKQKETFLNSDGYAAIGRVIREYEAYGLTYSIKATGETAKHAPKPENRVTPKLNPQHAAILRLLLLTGCRRREISRLERNSVDLDAATLTLTDDKTSRERVRPRKVYLSRQAVEILRHAMSHRFAHTYVFPIGKGDRPNDTVDRAWAVICEHAGIGHLRVHDIRHSYGSMARMLGFDIPIISSLLGHAKPSGGGSATTMRYVHVDDKPLRRAVQRIADVIEATLAGEVSEADNVIAMIA